jgi:hypothetical protein
VKQPRASDALCLGTVLMEQIGDLLDQCLHWKPGTWLKARIQGGVLLLESAFASPSSSHPSLQQGFRPP